MKQQIVTSNTKSDHILSQGVISNGFIFVSGQVHADENMALVGDTVKEKVDQIMQSIKAVLEAADAAFDDIVKVTIYVTDMAQMPELNEVYPTYFTKPLPAREAICVNALPLGATIEISAVAAK